MINTLEEALIRIKELEEENKQLLSELEYYRKKTLRDGWGAPYMMFCRI